MNAWMDEIYRGNFHPLRAPSLPPEAAILHVGEHEFHCLLLPPSPRHSPGILWCQPPAPPQTGLGGRTPGLIPVQTATAPHSSGAGATGRTHCQVQGHVGRAGPSSPSLTTAMRTPHGDDGWRPLASQRTPSPTETAPAWAALSLGRAGAVLTWPRKVVAPEGPGLPP